VGSRIAEGMRTALGMAPIRVFGIPAESHAAQVMVEADYRMKLIGIGLEPPPVRITSYFEATAASASRQQALQRWWFTPDYECVRTTADGFGMELVGQGVQLQTEANLVGADGKLKSGAPTSKASELFAQGFTKRYPELAERSPVYAQLRNVIDLFVTAAFIQRQGWAAKAGWRLGALGDDKAVPIRTLIAPKEAPCAVNATWRGSKFTSVAGGGVSIRPDEALKPERLLKDKDDRLSETRQKISTRPTDERWWWD
jgi:hypothetical protein